jgi:hypothetical protein
VAADLAALRACVHARCALLKGGAGGERPASGSADGEEFQDQTFKWDRESEEALYAVVQNSLAAGGPQCVMRMPSRRAAASLA